MPLITAILLDVSGSMKTNATGGSSAVGGKWVHSIFQVIDDLIKHDVSKDNEVFAIGVGARYSPYVFDVLGTLRMLQGKPVRKITTHYQYDYILENIYSILEQNGAYTIRKWGKPHVVKDAIKQTVAARILQALESDQQFVRKFVDCLPLACKDWAVNSVPVAGKVTGLLQRLSASVVTSIHSATKEEVQQVVGKALLQEVTASSIVRVQDASRIIHGSVGETDDLTQERMEELEEDFESYIYGATPFYTALLQATGLFSSDQYKEYKKLLFILSDGIPSDAGSMRSVVSRLEDVTVMTCFISSSGSVQPRRLYNSEQSEWQENAKLMFQLGSKIPTQQLPRTVFIKHGWTIDVANNETKLFVQVNHPIHIREACELARNVVCCQDGLSDMLGSVSLDMYINQSIRDFQAQDQREEGICYAIAAAAVLHLAMKRIFGRDGNYPSFESLKQEIICRHGQDGANTFSVLNEMCKKYRLRCRRVDNSGACEAITAKRPVVATFKLTGQEWVVFKRFFDNNPTGTLSSSKIAIDRPSTNSQFRRHAVVLASFNSQCLRLMNSWGSDWADMGFFRIRNAEVLRLKFIDVYWELDDLTYCEKENYRKYGADVAAKLIRDLVGLQKSMYKCPKCEGTSWVTTFTGNLSSAKCPVCCQSFRCDDEGNILALNLYLLSLSK